MSLKSRLSRKMTFALASALALMATSTSQNAAAQSKPADTLTTTKKTSPKQPEATRAAVFAKYDMLDSVATKAAFVKYLKQTKTTEAGLNLMSILDDKALNTTKLERALQPVVVGLGEDEVQLSLDVIMRDYYLSSLEQKKLSMSEVESLMESRATALDEAVFGKTSTKAAPAERSSAAGAAQASQGSKSSTRRVATRASRRMRR